MPIPTAASRPRRGHGPGRATGRRAAFALVAIAASTLGGPTAAAVAAAADGAPTDPTQTVRIAAVRGVVEVPSAVGVPSPAARLISPTVALLSWPAVPGASGYRVFNGVGRLVWSGVTPTVTRAGLLPGVRYSWQVQAVDTARALSALSAPVSLTAPPAVPVVQATVTAAGAVLRWAAAPGATAYVVSAVSASGQSTGPLRPVDTTALTLTGLVAGASSRWSVAATAADGTRSAWSAPVTVTAPTAAPSEVTAGLRTTPTGANPTATVGLRWTPSPGAVGYRVFDYRGRVVHTGPGTAAAVTGLSAGTRYDFRVASVNRAGLVSRRSLPADVLVPRAPDPKTMMSTVEWGGLTRRFYYAVPTGATAPAVDGPRPAIVLLHGDFDTAPKFLAKTRILTPALAAGEVVIAPESVGGQWNDGRLDSLAAGAPPGRDDVGFVLAAVDALVARGLVDPDRVTVSGYSNGAGLAMRIAAEDPSRVAELVSFSGALLADGRAVLPRSPVTTVLVHGDADLTQPWDGRDRANANRPAQMSQPDTRRAWQAADTANGVGVTTSITAPSWAPGLAITTIQHWHGDASLSFYRISGGTHQWPYEPCPIGVNTGCSADIRTNAQPERFDGTALLVQLASVASVGGAALPAAARPGPPSTR